MSQNQDPLDQTEPTASRRNFLKVTAAAATAGAIAVGAQALLRGAGPATTQGAPLRIGLIGCGGQGRHDAKNLMGGGEKIVALCDVDESQIDAARQELAKHAVDLAKSTKSATQPTDDIVAYGDYRKLLDGSLGLDAVIVATPDHWHAPIATAAIKAGKHVYCEKPLTHSVADARALGELAANSKVVTQLGNQGSAGASLRRSIELIQAGVLGQIREVHCWLNGGGFPHALERPEGDDPIPPKLNWDFWIGPSPVRPYKAKIYHPFTWRGWKDFGSGQLGDFGCHCMNLPLRALALTYPDRIDLDGPGWRQDAYSVDNRLQFHFPARGRLDALTLHWYDGDIRPADKIVADVLAIHPKLPLGTLLVGEKGVLFTNPWNNDCLIKLKDDAKLKDVTHHEPTKDVPQTLPRVKSHEAEFAAACRGVGATFSPFQIGGHLTEIALSGVIALRLGKSITWDGQAMQSPDEPAAGKLARMEWRKKWIG